MSMLIKGAKKPDHCLLCFAFRDDMCAVAKKEVVLSKGVQEWCPLVEIPPHGELIDKGALMESVEETYCTPCPHDGDYDYCKACLIDDALDAIEDAPTVIESEGNDECSD